MKIIVIIQLLISIVSSNTFFEFTDSNHTNNWAVLVDTSRFWFNYRHVANVLSIYQSVKRLGIPDSHIILMIADDMACNPRNPYPSTVFNNANRFVNVYDNDVEVDYRGFEVTVENFIRILINRLPHHTPNSKRLLSNDKSNILIYLTGHGGDGFLKFQDSEELTSHEFADAIEQMWLKQRYNEIFFMIDTCQAATMFQEIYSPNVLSIASSSFGEDSLSHHLDYTIGVYIIDRFTYYALEFLQNLRLMDTKTIAEFFRICPKHQCISTVANRTDLFKRNIRKTHVTDFFGSKRLLTVSKRAEYLENDLFQSSDIATIYLDDNLMKNNDLRVEQEHYKYVDQFPLF